VLTEKIAAIWPACTRWRFNFSLLVTSSTCTDADDSLPRCLCSLKLSELPRSPFTPAVLHDHHCAAWLFGLCSLSYVACPWSLLDDLLAWLRSVRRFLPTNTRNQPLKTVMKTTELKMLRTSPWLCTSPTGHSRYRSHAWNTWSRHALHWCSLQLSPSRKRKKKTKMVLQAVAVSKVFLNCTVQCYMQYLRLRFLRRRLRPT
jgi:hypothetical protein